MRQPNHIWRRGYRESKKRTSRITYTEQNINDISTMLNFKEESYKDGYKLENDI